jgi:hypothetical protein
MVKDPFDEMGGFRARQAQIAMNDVGQVGARERARQPRLPVHSCDSQIGHFAVSSPPRLSVPDSGFRTVTEMSWVGNSTLAEFPALFNI